MTFVQNFIGVDDVPTFIILNSENGNDVLIDSDKITAVLQGSTRTSVYLANDHDQRPVYVRQSVKDIRGIIADAESMKAKATSL